MKYRGVEYQPAIPDLEIMDSDIVECYRGQKIRQKYVKHLPESSPEFQLRYRGVDYTIGSDPSLIEQRSVSSEADEQEVVSMVIPMHRTSAIRSARSAETHHHNLSQNLEHRLEVARTQGNSSLVEILEAERENI
jgi:Domain of unknown function (DUF4278)